MAKTQVILVESLPHPRVFLREIHAPASDKVIVGGSSLYHPGTGIKWVIREDAIPDFQRGGRLDSPSAVARHFLADSGADYMYRLCRANSEAAADAHNFHDERGVVTARPFRAPPRGWILGPLEGSEWALVDVVAAYPTIIRQYGYNLSWPDAWGYDGSLVHGDDFLPDFDMQAGKSARSALVSLGLYGSINWWSEEKGNERTLFFSRLLNPTIPHFCSDVLWLIGSWAWKLGARYWHTDGGIIPISSYDFLEKKVSEIGLSLAIKETGGGAVVAPNGYRIGGRETRHYRKCATAHGRAKGKPSQEVAPFLPETETIFRRNLCRALEKKHKQNPFWVDNRTRARVKWAGVAWQSQMF